MTFPLAWCVASTSTSAIWTCFGAEAADKMETVLFDSIHKRTDREESISDNDIGDLQQILLVTLDDRYVMLHESHVAQFQLSCRWSLMGAQHHATVGIDIGASPMISSPCFMELAQPDQKVPICGVFLPDLLM